MQTSIYKYRLLLQDEQSVSVPGFTRVLSVGLDPEGHLCMWVACMPESKEFTDVPVSIVGTGHAVPESLKLHRFKGSVVQQQYVWHVFAGWGE